MVPSSLPLQAFSVACAPYLNLVNNLMQDNQETTSDTSKQPILYKFVCFSLFIFSVKCYIFFNPYRSMDKNGLNCK